MKRTVDHTNGAQELWKASVWTELLSSVGIWVAMLVIIIANLARWTYGKPILILHMLAICVYMEIGVIVFTHKNQQHVADWISSLIENKQHHIAWRVAKRTLDSISYVCERFFNIMHVILIYQPFLFVTPIINVVIAALALLEPHSDAGVAVAVLAIFSLLVNIALFTSLVSYITNVLAAHDHVTQYIAAGQAVRNSAGTDDARDNSKKTG